jgi:hypothetical protein
VPSKRIPYFKPSKELKDLVNASTAEPQPDDDEPTSNNMPPVSETNPAS